MTVIASNGWIRCKRCVGALSVVMKVRKKTLVDGKVGLAYRMDYKQMSVDRPWDIFFMWLVVNCFFVLDLSIKLTCEVNKQVHPINQKEKNQKSKILI